MKNEHKKCERFDSCAVDIVVLVATIIVGIVIIAWLPSAKKLFEADYKGRQYMIIQIVLYPMVMFGLGYIFTWCFGKIVKLHFVLNGLLQILFVILVIVIVVGYATMNAGYYLFGWKLSHALIVGIVINREIMIIPGLLLCLSKHCKNS